MDPNITAMLEQMRSQQQQQQQQHEAMMQRLVEQQAAQTPIGSREQKPGDPAARVEGRSELIPKFISCPQFNGKPENWEDFQFKFRRAIRSQSATAHAEMIKAEGSETVVNDDDIEVNASQETSACLFDILCQHVEGEALMIIKSVAGFHGFEAWRRLHRKYSPRTLARRLRLLMAVVNPGKIKNMGEIQSSLTMWEEKIKQLETQFDDNTISDQLKVAIITSALPSKAQGHIFSQATKDPTYDQVKELILTFAARMENCSGPTPMDVGNLQTPGGPWSGEPSGPWSGEQCQPCGNEGYYDEDYGWQEEAPWQEDHSTPFQDVNGIQDAICYSLSLIHI